MEKNINQIEIDKLSSLVKSKTRIHNLRRSEKKVVKYILKNPLDITDMTINELARKANCSEATVVRTCNNLDFDGFQGLKFSLQKDIEENLSRMYDQVKPEDDIKSVVEKVFKANAKAIDDTLNMIDVSNFKEALSQLKAANNIALFAQGGATPVAEDFYHALINIGRKCIWQPDSNMQLITSQFLKKGDVCMAISRSGEIKDVVDAAKIAKKGGVYCIGLTAKPASPLADIVDITLYTNSQNQVFRNIDNAHRITLLTILDALYIGLANDNYSKTNGALKLATKATSLKRNSKL